MVAYLEPHDRPETAAQADGLEQLPRRRLDYRGTEVDEMDLPAIFLRAPDLCLIDELAHTNAPGAEHRKRYEDIEDVLDAGIDVFSTVNVQHLESLNDRVFELTGVRVRETFPDSVLRSADEIVLVDLTPEALIQRLREGKVYPPERVAASLNGFFRVENLAALREVALREVAEEVESKRVPALPAPPRRHSYRRRHDCRQAARDGRRARARARPAQARSGSSAALGARPSAWARTLDLLYVAQPGSIHGDERERIEALRRLAALLGARLHVEEGEDLVEIAARIVAEHRITYVIIGQPGRRAGLGRLRESLPDRLIHALPGVDLRIVADRVGESDDGG